MFVFKCTVIVSARYLLNLLFGVSVSAVLSPVGPAHKQFCHFLHKCNMFEQINFDLILKLLLMDVSELCMACEGMTSSWCRSQCVRALSHPPTTT